MRNRRGLMVAFLGADGSGKSTVARAVAERLTPEFSDAVRMHLRPRFALPAGDDAPVPAPHAAPPRSAPVSALKALYFALDYNLGYVLSVRPRLKAGALVMFDRYCHDMLIDPRRYRYGAPLWTLEWLAAVVPRPDLWLLLDASPAVLRARKQEVALEELARLGNAYRRLIRELPGGVLINAEQPLDTMVDAAIAHIRCAHASR